ncbi:MAG TPA: hypothetical protein P5555_17210 [Candidatus Paceibacterota bacterium]|nr:hypothetical protein [Verrucomicrobiota bacterium]HRZ46918.1 hypothetical protein [Candidatus Paceibacterota bacterium]
MAQTESKGELLHSLASLVRGLSALFWGLPLALVVGIQTARTDWLQPFGIIPPVLAAGLLYYGLVLLGRFRAQEPAWIRTLDRLKLLALANMGLAPFLVWWRRMPGVPWFAASVALLALTSLVFLILLNTALRRLAALLPDETLRLETHLFTTFNLYLLTLSLGLTAAGLALFRWGAAGSAPPVLTAWLSQTNPWLLVLLVLLPLAMSMALLWKIKEAIFQSVFDSRDEPPDHSRS